MKVSIMLECSSTCGHKVTLTLQQSKGMLLSPYRSRKELCNGFKMRHIKTDFLKGGLARLVMYSRCNIILLHCIEVAKEGNNTETNDTTKMKTTDKTKKDKRKKKSAKGK